jgi:hypothetical protein
MKLTATTTPTLTSATALQHVDHDAAAVDESHAAAPSFREQFYEVEEFAEAVDRKPETIWRWWRQGQGPPYVLLGRRRVIPRSGALEWLRQSQVTPPRSFKLCSAARRS